MTPSPNRVNPRRKKGKEKRERADLAYLAVKEPTAREEKKAELRGCCSLDSGHMGAAARPLDGGALTRWGARTPTRGPATAPWLPPWLPRSTVRSFACSSLGCGCAALRRKEREAMRERAPGRMKLGFFPGARGVGILSERNARSAVGSAQMAEIERASIAAQAGALVRGALPTQAHVAAWVRPARARRTRPSRLLPSWAALG